jgi:hypothetical protein
VIIKMEDGWNDIGSHDSRYTEEEVKTLVGQVRNLPGVSTRRNRQGMGRSILAFVTACVEGDTTVWVTKGIHERWQKINAANVTTKEADPHIQVKYQSGSGWGTVHIRRSEKPERVVSEDGKDFIDCSWTTVGMSSKWHGNMENWPAYFTQEVQNIQYQGAGKRGLKKRYSIGLIVPEEFRTKEELVA